MGCLRPADVGRLDRSRAQILSLPAGSIHIHHYRLVHWSAPNTSPAESALFGRLVRGTEPRVVRRTEGHMPLPPDFSRGYTSIDELQTQGATSGGSSMM